MWLQTSTIHKYSRKLEVMGNARKHLDGGKEALHRKKKRDLEVIIGAFYPPDKGGNAPAAAQGRSGSWLRVFEETNQ